MSNKRELIPKPRSSFLLVKCPDCGEERVVFSYPSRDIGCKGCGSKLVKSTGGKGIILGRVIKRLD
jgi:small subunit ribosomal protein S27e